jgi:hypothetical protein
MIVAAEELCEGDLIHFKSGTRALQPEYEDMYIVACSPFDLNPAEVVIFLLEMWEETPEVVNVLRREKVEIIRVHS